jgi:hypothetical protein
MEGAFGNEGALPLLLGVIIFLHRSVSLEIAIESIHR